MSTDAVMKRLEQKAAAKCFTMATKIQAEARKNLSGDVLNVQTGNLRNAVQVVPLPAGEIGYAVGITGSPNPENGARASVYGAAWERGFDRPDGSHEAPRPFMRPAVDKVKAGS